VRLLIVEDEVKTGAYLQQGLSEAGFTVDVAITGEDGLHHATTSVYDLIILDIMLPGINGFDILEKLRQNGHLSPVIFLSAKDRVEDRVKGFELGADDYLVKPFSFSELLARIRALLRRGRTIESHLVSVADLNVDFLKRRVTRAGNRIDLTAKEFALLELLIRRKSEVLPKSLIASQVWDMNFDSDTNVVEVAMRRLRSKIDDPFDIKLIKTIRGMGYSLEDPLAS
jgi:two-component system, OmpR family, copper resistance phosphate regulon response regulator CusR